ncbi:amidase [Loktanella sp. 3ANDIMAR09]|uniref:amidase n=1 Tax=Loktanella sp. 3ANDIMAR09 TaxID=1225657 RepID=UPI0006F98FCD|nr:amidase [Loktanella sp. 3ANDIMAR09]KQI68638.1 amidase [Loktanella sp. 3ANDIMAR09]
MDHILDQDALSLSAALADGQLTAEQVMQATLDRIARRNPDLNAIVALRDADDLLAEARAADNVPRKGWLHGIPIAVKDLSNAAGLPTSMGSPALAGRVAKTSDIMVQRMQDAGAIVIGKTNTPEFGLGSHTFNPVFGATQNGLRRGRSAGGSSGGAAVALSSRMIAVADGSDMMGSLRNPAGWNGVYGMRPTWGLVPSEPAGDSFLHQLSTNGPMARSPADLSALLATQSGHDPRQPHGLPAYVHGSLDADLTGRRIGWLGDWGGAYPMEDGVLDHCATQIHRMSDLGCSVMQITPPFDAAALWDSWITLRSFAIAGSLGSLYDNAATRDALKPEAIWEIERGRALSARDIQRASNIRSDWFRAAARLFDRVDAVVLPTAQCWPFPLDWTWPRDIAGVTMDTYHRWMEVVVPASLIGLPAVAVPLPQTAAGEPMGLQFIGRARDDRRLLELAQGWHRINA